jgi:hypothetical protein
MSETGEAANAQPLFQEIAPAQRERTYVFSALRGITVALSIALASRLVLQIAYGVGLVLRLRFLDAVRKGQFLTNEAILQGAKFSDTLVQVTALLGVAALLAAYVLGGIWMYRAACNVRALGARGFDTTPGWTVGWFFVPIANWFKPFVAMSEIWRASHDPQRWKSATVPPLLGFWWAGWVLTNLGGAVVSGVSRASPGVDGLTMVSELGLAEAVVDCAGVGLFLAVVLGVTRAQSATRHTVQRVADTFA